MFSVRWINEDLVFHDNFNGPYEMEKTGATKMVAVIQDIILRFGLKRQKLQGHCYDRCSTMMGKKKGVAT